MSDILHPIRAWRRRRLRRRAIPDAWAPWIQALPLLRDVPDGDRDELAGHLQILLAEKRFFGCGGLAVDEQVRVTIAAQAAVLLLHRNAEPFPSLRSILVYPDAFRAPVEEWSDDGWVVTEGTEVRSGEASEFGQVVLSWADICDDIRNPGGGANVVLHEFAHHLDLENGALDGTPRLAGPQAARNWATTMAAAYQALQDAVDAGREDGVLDPYAAEDPSEFFAVLVETFFDAPVGLRDHHPDLYACLSGYFGQDPASWTAGRS